jgi:hypothetical protein
MFFVENTVLGKEGVPAASLRPGWCGVCHSNTALKRWTVEVMVCGKFAKGEKTKMRR